MSQCIYLLPAPPKPNHLRRDHYLTWERSNPPCKAWAEHKLDQIAAPSIKVAVGGVKSPHGSSAVHYFMDVANQMALRWECLTAGDFLT